MLQEWWLEGWRTKINRSNERKERLKKKAKNEKKKETWGRLSVGRIKTWRWKNKGDSSGGKKMLRRKGGKQSEQKTEKGPLVSSLWWDG